MLFGDLKNFYNLIEQGIEFQVMVTSDIELRFIRKASGLYSLRLCSKKGKIEHNIDRSICLKSFEMFLDNNVGRLK